MKSAAQRSERTVRQAVVLTAFTALSLPLGFMQPTVTTPIRTLSAVSSFSDVPISREVKAAAVQSGPVRTSPTGAQPAASTTARIGEARKIVVSIPERKLAIVERGRVKMLYPVAVGAQESPSPTGHFRIVNKVAHPGYWHSGTVVAPGSGNPVGSRWIGLDRAHYGIHGTNEPESIGQAASHGCVRMERRDLEELFAQVRVGDEVLIADVPIVAATEAAENEGE